MGDGLRAIDQNAGAMPVSHLDHLSDGRDGAERVRDMREGHLPGGRSEQGLVGIQSHLPAIVDGNHAQAGARVDAELLPRHDVGVVLEPGDDDLVVATDVFPAPALRHEIDRLGGQERIFMWSAMHLAAAGTGPEPPP